MLTTLFAALALAAPPDTIPSRWEFRDSATFNGRPLLTYCPVELSDKPPRPVHPDDDPGRGARYGLLPLGNHLDGFSGLCGGHGCSPAVVGWGASAGTKLGASGTASTGRAMSWHGAFNRARPASSPASGCRRR